MDIKEMIQQLKDRARAEGKSLSQLIEDKLSENSLGKSHESKQSCSFCGKSKLEVKKLIAGPSAHICDQCIRTCMEIVEDV